MFTFPNPAPYSFCTNVHSVCKSALKPQPFDLYQIRRAKPTYCFSAFSPKKTPQVTLVQTKSTCSHTSMWIIGRSRTCCLSYCLFYLLRLTRRDGTLKHKVFHGNTLLSGNVTLQDVEETHIFKILNPSHRSTQKQAVPPEYLDSIFTTQMN